MSEQQIVLSEIDFVRLNKFENLNEVLDQADISNCASIPPELVTMNSKISYLRLSDQKVREITIVYPENADLSNGLISILSPLGKAFLGRHKGETVSCDLPNGETSLLKILDILYQPEAKGDFHL
jgi:regulator of nucleoside diphosphate kinase